MVLIWALFKKNRATFILAALAGLISAAGNVFLVSTISQLISGKSDFVARWQLLALVLFLVSATGIFARHSMIQLSQRLVMNLRINMCRHILELPFRRWEEVGRARLDALFTQDTPAIAEALVTAPRLLMSLVVILGCLVFLGSVSPWGLVASLSILFLVISSYWIPEKRAGHFVVSSRQAWDDLLRNFDALNRGAKELRLHRARREEFLQRTVQGSADEVRSTNARFQTVYAVLAYWEYFLYFAMIGAILFLIPNLWTISQEKVFTFVIVLLYLVSPLGVVFEAIPILRTADVAFLRLRNTGMLELESAGVEPQTGGGGGRRKAKARAETFSRLEWDGVTHCYQHKSDERDFVLGPIDFSLKAGELVFIVGGNGSGKTTLAKLLVGLYEPSAGRITYNGRPVTDANREEYRENFSAIFSNFFIFEKFLGLDDELLEEQAARYLRMLDLEHKVQIRDRTLSTTALSSGQRKRLALLVLYLEDRPLYLFDEWAADQDPEFKRFFYLELLPDLKRAGKTVIVISHDDRYYCVADRIAKLEGGRLVTWTDPFEAESVVGTEAC